MRRRVSPEVVIELTTAGKVAAPHGDIRIPLSAITGVEVVPDALAAVRGLRAPGLALPGRAKIGTWRTTEGAEFVVARRGQPGIRFTLSGHELASVLLGEEDAGALAERIRAVRRASPPQLAAPLRPGCGSRSSTSLRSGTPAPGLDDLQIHPRRPGRLLRLAGPGAPVQGTGAPGASHWPAPAAALPPGWSRGAGPGRA